MSNRTLALLVTLLAFFVLAGVAMRRGEPVARSALGFQAPERPLSQADRSLLAAFHAALDDPTVREASREHVLRQIRSNPPVAFVDGYWVTPIDLSQTLLVPAVADVLEATIGQTGHADEARQLLRDLPRLKQLTALAFTAHGLREEAAVPFVGDFQRVTETKAQSFGILVVPVKDVDWVIVEYLPPTVAPSGTEPECYFFCGDPVTWDFDGDGTPNHRDGDDDADGVSDETDDYPYWPGGNACPCGSLDLFAFTTKFSTQITDAVRAAYDLVGELGEERVTTVLGPTPGGESEVRFVYPTSVVPPIQAQRDCPDPADPGVSYVSTDVQACATLRFRCEQGQVPFSDRCGCGCVAP